MKKLFFIFLTMFSFSVFGNIKAVVFDYGGVLTEVVDKTMVKDFLKNTFIFSDTEFVDTWKKFKASKMDEEKFFALLAKEKNIILPQNWFSKLEEIMLQSIKLNPDMVKLVKEIKDKGYKVVIFSNIKKPLDSYLKNMGHFDGYDNVVLSSEIGCEKPDPNSYKILMEKLNLKADEFVFIDDAKINVEAAIFLKIDSIHFKGCESLKEELAKRKIF